MKKAKSKKAKSKKAASKSKVSAKAKLSAKSGKKKVAAKRGTANRRGLRTRNAESAQSQSVETVQVKPRALRARAGAGGGDFGGVSTVERADSESANELLEEGQAFEAGVVSGVEDAPDADQGEIRTREVPQDDVPEEYDDKDRR
ncbi:MAG TPA: hypothetical protein VKQ28_15905 [Candidatus Acidoferrum sp.]|nr:hypothetical protein [Candidatus Acidoferrum sp.]